MDAPPPRRALIVSQEGLVDYEIADLSPAISNAKLTLKGSHSFQEFKEMVLRLMGPLFDPFLPLHSTLTPILCSVLKIHPITSSKRRQILDGFSIIARDAEIMVQIYIWDEKNIGNSKKLHVRNLPTFLPSLSIFWLTNLLSRLVTLLRCNIRTLEYVKQSVQWHKTLVKFEANF